MPPPLRLNDSRTTALEVAAFGARFTIEQRPDSQNHGLGLWDASLAFIRFVEERPALLEAMRAGARVVEFGSGTGFAAIALAALGAHVVATDLDSVIPLLARNVSRNAAAVMDGVPASLGARGSVRVARFSWDEPIEAL
jgi:predicted nicotinamide N-methyase